MLEKQYALETLKLALETLKLILEISEEGNIAQHKWNFEAYNAWKKKNTIACITMLSSIYGWWCYT